MEDFASELEVVFADKFDRDACLALRKATANLTNGKKRVIKSLLSDFGYSEEYCVLVGRESTPVSSLMMYRTYQWKESPWLESVMPTPTALTAVKSSLMGTVGSSTIQDFIVLLNADPRRIAWQWSEYWKVLMYSFPNEGYVNS